MHVIAVTTPFTKAAFSKNKLIDERWIVNDPESLPQIVKQLMSENSSEGWTSLHIIN
jgi:hypothetical protein